MKKISFLLAAALLCVQLSAQRPGEGNLRSAQGNFNQYLANSTVENLDANAAKKAGFITAFNNTENTIGKRFLFDTWVKGDSVLDMQGNYINAVAFLFNYDKLTGNLLVTQDNINIMAVVPSGISSFILQNGGHLYVFEHANAIDNNKFFEVLLKSDKQYALYKLHGTKFIPANNKNEGVIKSGSEYDEYKEENQYFIVDSKTGQSTGATLKPKAIKAALKAQTEKVETYFRTHKGDPVDELFLKGLISFLNQ